MVTNQVQIDGNSDLLLPRFYRAAWLMVAGLNVLLAVLAIPHEVAAHRAVAEEFYSAALAGIHLTPTFLAIYRTIMDQATILAFTVVAGIIFWKKPADRMVLLSSLAIMTFGSLFVPSLIYLMEAQSTWLLPVAFLRAVGLATSLIALYYLLPDGRFVPGWTRWLALVWAAASFAWFLFPDAPFNLVHLISWVDTLGASVALYLAAYSSGIAVQVYRFQYVSTPAQRQQTKWVVIGTTLAVVGFVLYYLPIVTLPALAVGTQARLLYTLLAIPVFHILVLAAPLLIGFSVLRYRLWDIGLIVNRSLVYGALTVSLVLIYVASVLVFGMAVDALSGQPRTELVTAAATLLSSALFVPLRNRLQDWIDRRFNRRRYDTTQTLAAFSSLARSEVDVSRLSARLLEVVEETFQPTQATLWLRRGAAVQPPDDPKL